MIQSGCVLSPPFLWTIILNQDQWMKKITNMNTLIICIIYFKSNLIPSLVLYLMNEKKSFKICIKLKHRKRFNFCSFFSFISFLKSRFFYFTQFALVLICSESKWSTLVCKWMISLIHVETRRCKWSDFCFNPNVIDKYLRFISLYLIYIYRMRDQDWNNLLPYTKHVRV